MMMHRKAQLSIETLIVYGLIVLVALSAVGALLYFGVLDLGSYLPDTCDIGGSGVLDCEEMAFSGSSIQLGIRNNGQRAIELLEVAVDDADDVHFSTETAFATGKYSTGDIATSNVLPPGEIASVTIALPAGDTALSGRVLKGIITTKFKLKDGAITQEATGTLRIKAN